MIVRPLREIVDPASREERLAAALARCCDAQSPSEIQPPPAPRGLQTRWRLVGFGLVVLGILLALRLFRPVEVAPPISVVSTELRAPVVADSRAPERAAPVVAKHKPTVSRAVPRPSPSPAANPAPAEEQGEDFDLIVDALRALRSDHDPRGARTLSARYLALHPSGALAEEAQAVDLEAALAMHEPNAVKLAERYLARYPSGRYARNARQVQKDGPTP